MAIAIAPTPVLEGEEATNFWDKVLREQDHKVSVVPTPKLEALRQEILADVKRRKK